MKPKQNPLTDVELLIPLEGVITEVDLDTSDDQLELDCDRNEHAVPTSPTVPGLDSRIIEVQKEEE